jgi:hypothetical protein
MAESTKKMNVGDTLTLSGKTQHGRNRVREQGAEWIVLELKIAQLHSVFPAGTPVALLAASDAPKDFWRWIRQTNDKNFQIDEVETS